MSDVNIDKLNFASQDKLYSYMNIKLTGLLSADDDWLAGMANASALFWLLVSDINWVGFYLYKNGELVLGPFQGKPACVRIPLGSGVCGTAALQRAAQLVPDVHLFPGHIACDSASKSEIVVPIICQDRLIGVFDVDSPSVGRFDELDLKYVGEYVGILTKYVKFPDKFV